LKNLKEIGLVEGKDMLATLYKTRKELYVQKTALLGNDFVTRALGT